MPPPPPGLCDGPYFRLQLTSAGGGLLGTAGARPAAAQVTPGIFTLTASRSSVTLWATGLGPVQQSGELQTTILSPSVTIGGVGARILFSGPAPGWLGLYQVDIAMPENLSFPTLVDFHLGAYESRAWINPQPGP